VSPVGSPVVLRPLVGTRFDSLPLTWERQRGAAYLWESDKTDIINNWAVSTIERRRR
jgi:hypothetical protein